MNKTLIPVIAILAVTGFAYADGHNNWSDSLLDAKFAEIDSNIAALNATTQIEQSEINDILQYIIPDYTKDPIVVSMDMVKHPSKNTFTGTFLIQSFHDQADMIASASSAVCYNGINPGHTLPIYHQLGLDQYTLSCMWSSDANGPFSIDFRGELDGNYPYIE